MLIVACANQKGGSAKTTTAVNLAGFLAADHGKRVVLVDLDSQAGASAALGALPAEDAPTVTDALGGAGWPLYGTAVDNLHVVPSSFDLALVSNVNASQLRGRLAELDADVVVLDTAPAATSLGVAALGAADWVLIPVECRPLAYRGLATQMEMLSALGVKRSRVLILPTRLDRRTKLSPEMHALIVEDYGARVLPPIPENTALATAMVYQQPICTFQRSSTGGKAYAALAATFARKRA